MQPSCSQGYTQCNFISRSERNLPTVYSGNSCSKWVLFLCLYNKHFVIFQFYFITKYHFRLDLSFIFCMLSLIINWFAILRVYLDVTVFYLVYSIYVICLLHVFKINFCVSTLKSLFSNFPPKIFIYLFGIQLRIILYMPL